MKPKYPRFPLVVYKNEFDIGPFCPICGSSFKRILFFFRTDKCVSVECPLSSSFGSDNFLLKDLQWIRKSPCPVDEVEDLCDYIRRKNIGGHHVTR